MAELRGSPNDNYHTETSEVQSKTESVLEGHRPADPESPPPLQRNQHLQFLVRNLVQGFPSRYISQDASQPWLLYWLLQSFSTLGVGLDLDNKQRYEIRGIWMYPTNDLPVGLSIRSWPGSIQTVDLVVVLDNKLTSYQLMQQCVPLQSLGDRGRMVAGTRSTGELLMVPRLRFVVMMHPGKGYTSSSCL